MGAAVRQGQASQFNESLFTKIRQISQLQKYIIGTSFSFFGARNLAIIAIALPFPIFLTLSKY